MFLNHINHAFDVPFPTWKGIPMPGIGYFYVSRSEGCAMHFQEFSGTFDFTIEEDQDL